MSILPRQDDTPFSLPEDVPEVMPIDYPELDVNLDSQEAYDEGLDDTLDVDPYRLDDDPIKSAKRLLKPSPADQLSYTTSPDTIRNWMQYRYGHPAQIRGAVNGLNNGGLYIDFEDELPDIEIDRLSWEKFFNIFETHQLAFAFRPRATSGASSRFYRFINRRDIGRIS